MKICILILVLTGCICKVTTLSLAQETTYQETQPPTQDTETIIGTLVSIDPAKNEIVVKNSTAGWMRTAIVDPQLLPGLKINSTVKVVLKQGTANALSVKKFIRKKSKKAKERKEKEKKEKEEKEKQQK
jgi:hypothetical protein